MSQPDGCDTERAWRRWRIMLGAFVPLRPPREPGWSDRRRNRIYMEFLDGPALVIGGVSESTYPYTEAGGGRNEEQTPDG